jgi:SAM-dependent methyltransferase
LGDPVWCAQAGYREQGGCHSLPPGQTPPGQVSQDSTRSMEKKTFDYQGYGEYLYTGLQGFVMRQNHRILSKGVRPETNRKILEIGGGAKLHCSLVELEGVEEYWVSETEEVFRKLLKDNEEIKSFQLKNHIFDKDPDYAELKAGGHRFSRIIASHVWEHVPDPEGYLLKWMDLLEEDGQLDIAIPCDPGWLWRLGQLVSRRKAMSVYNMTSREIDLLMTREHVNSCQNLVKIMRYYSSARAVFYPTPIPISDINLFVFFRVFRKDFNA